MASNENLSQHRFMLNNGSGEIPALGFGTSLSDRKETRNAVKTAVEVAFRHLGAAERYRNEAEVGAALGDFEIVPSSGRRGTLTFRQSIRH